MDDDRSNQPLSEQFRLVAKKWVDADNAASLMENSESTVLAQSKAALILVNPGLADNAADRMVKCEPAWGEFRAKKVNARTEANKLKLQLEYIRMKHSEQMSFEATQRAEMKL